MNSHRQVFVKKQSQKKSAGFSLVELLAVLAIISILISLLSPTILNGLRSAKRTKSALHLRQIALAHLTCHQLGTYRFNAKNLSEFAVQLAKKTKLNDPSVYYDEDDYLVQKETKSIPKAILDASNAESGINKSFSSFPLSFVVIQNLSSEAPLSTTPFAYTRGLGLDGVWKAAEGDDGGVYGGDGGHIVFLDGHVRFYENLTDPQNQLLKYGTSESTSNIQEAVNKGAQALDWKGILWQ